MIKYILTDIEGTTSDIRFVKEVLFPYAAKHLPGYIRNYHGRSQVHEQLVMIAQDQQRSVIHIEDHIEALIEILLSWIDQDLKKTPLKTLQGQVWRHGYEQGDFKGHLYDDSYECLKYWSEQKIGLGVYSSGSVDAQKLLFAHSVFGDLTDFFSHHYDTQVGHKREVSAYQNILNDLLRSGDISAPQEVLFLSDVVEELDAAHQSGMVTVEVRRDEQVGSLTHTSVSSFKEIDLSRFNVESLTI